MSDLNESIRSLLMSKIEKKKEDRNVRRCDFQHLTPKLFFFRFKTQEIKLVLF